jgi:uncharacterized protein
VNRSDNDNVANSVGWLTTTIVGRVCLDMLRARRSRRENYVGSWLPEPIVNLESDSDPEQEAMIADAVGLALLVVLETLSPPERLAFVLHDIFAIPFEEIAPIVERRPDAARQLTSRARRRIQGGAEPDTDLTPRKREIKRRASAGRPSRTCGASTNAKAPRTPRHGIWRARQALRREMQAHVVGISLAPVKAMALVHPDEVVVGAIGVVGNRRFWLRDENGNLFNAKKEGKLLQIRPQWDESSRRLALTFPDGRRVEGVVELGEPVDAFVYGELRPSRGVSGAAWAEAVSDFVGRPLELLWADDNGVDRLTSEGTVSLISMASLDRLREEMGVDRPIDPRRFRMLFQIDGVGPNEEDTWIGRHLQLGDAELIVTGDIGRCVVTSRDPDTGITDMPTLAALAGYRREGHSEPLPLGVKGTVYTPGRVRVGDLASPL